MSAKPPIDLIASSLRRERERAGLTLTEVARRAGMAKSTLSQLESGTGNPNLETLWAICTVLGVQFSRLLEPPRPSVTVIRAGEGPAVAAGDSNHRATLLAACPPGVRRDVYWIDAEPGKPRVSEPHPRGVMEHVVMGYGRSLVGIAGEPVELSPGDYACYPGDVPHVFEALSPGTRAVLVLEYVLPRKRGDLLRKRTVRGQPVVDGDVRGGRLGTEPDPRAEVVEAGQLSGIAG